MAAASLTIPSPNMILFNLGYQDSFTKLNEATVSAEVKTQANNKISFDEKLCGIIKSI